MVSIKYHHRHNKMIQFQCTYGSDIEENKQELIEVEAMPINVYDISGDKDVERFAFIMILVKY